LGLKNNSENKNRIETVVQHDSVHSANEIRKLNETLTFICNVKGQVQYGHGQSSTSAGIVDTVDATLHDVVLPTGLSLDDMLG